MKNHLRENLLAMILSIRNIRGLGTPLNQQNKPRNITVRHKTVSGMVCLSQPFWSLCNVLDSKRDERVVLQVLGTSTHRNGMIYPGSSSIDGPPLPSRTYQWMFTSLGNEHTFSQFNGCFPLFQDVPLDILMAGHG